VAPGSVVFGRLARWVLARPRPIAACFGLLVLLAFGGLVRLELDFSSTSFYGGDDRDLHDLADFRDRWGPDDRELSVLVSAEDSSGVLTLDRLERIQRLAEALQGDPDVVEVVALSSLVIDAAGVTVLEQARSIVEPAAGLEARAELLGHPRVVPLLLSGDGRHTVVVARLAHSTDELSTTVTTVGRLETIVATHDGADGLELQLAGLPAIRAAFFGLTIRDQAIFVPAALLLVGLVLWSTYRRLDCVIIAGLAAGLPVLLLLGIMGWAGEPIGLLNQAYFTLLPVIAIADAIHLLERTHEELRAGAPPREAVARAAGHVGWACLLTTLTTGLGFASLAISGMPILRNFGLFAALGIALSYATVLLAIPPALAIAVERRPKPRALRAPGALAAWCHRVVRRRGWVLAAATAMVAFAGLGARQLEVDNRLSDLLEADHPVARASSVVDAQLGGVLALEVDLDGPPRAWDEPAIRRATEAFATWARGQPEIRAVVRTVASDESGDRARLSLRTADIGGAAFGRLRERVHAEVGQQFEGTVIDARLTGTPAVAYRGINRITGDLRRALLGMFVIVTVLIGILLRSVRLAAMSILPNVLPLACAYGFVGWTATHLDPLATVILTVALGIAVDDTIHVLARYAREREVGHPPSEAMANALEATGRAVIITSVTLAIGLLVNCGSSFPPLQMLGTLGVVAMVLAMVADLGLLPALVSWSRPTPGPGSPQGSESRGARRR
jgi:uncharacterized protein